MTATTPAPQIEQVRRRPAARTAPADTRSALKVVTETTAVNIRGRLEYPAGFASEATFGSHPLTPWVLRGVSAFVLPVTGQSL